MKRKFLWKWQEIEASHDSAANNVNVRCQWSKICRSQRCEANMPLLQSQVPGASRFSCSQKDAWATWWNCNPQSTECTQVCVSTGAESICEPSPAPLPLDEKDEVEVIVEKIQGPPAQTQPAKSTRGEVEKIPRNYFLSFGQPSKKLRKNMGWGFFSISPINWG